MLRIWDVRDVESLDVEEMGRLGCGMFETWDNKDVGCLRCGMFGM